MQKDTGMISGQRISRAVRAIVDMPACKAEKRIETIADRNGDEWAKDILAHLPPVKIAEILRQYDFSCPSIISWMMTPECIVGILRVDPLFWQQVYNKKNTGNLIKIQNDALDLISSILLNAKSREQQEAILQHISNDDLGRLYLFLPFVGWEIGENQPLEFEDPEAEWGTADHLYETIRWAAPHVAGQIIDFVYPSVTSLLYHITDLWSEALHPLEKGDVASIENTMFLPMD